MLISSTDHNDHLLKIQFQVSLHWNEVKDSILKEYYTKQKRNWKNIFYKWEFCVRVDC